MPEDRRQEFEASRAARVAALRARLSAAPTDCGGGLPPGVPVTLEIGCGHGHFLAAYAAAHPEQHCLGVDLLTKRVERCLRKRDRAALRNLDFLKADAFELVEALPDDARLGAIFLIHPDPWPKSRHHKNRLLQHRLLDHLAAHSTPAHTRLHFRTDHEGYHDWSREILQNRTDWHLLPDAPWPFEHETFFSKILPVHQDLIAVRV